MNLLMLDSTVSEISRMPGFGVPLFPVVHWRLGQELGGAKRNEKPIPINNIHPRLERAAASATRMLRRGLNKNAAKITVATTVPITPARLPNNKAMSSKTALNTRGTQTCQRWPEARALIARAATAQMAAPANDSAPRGMRSWVGPDGFSLLTVSGSRNRMAKLRAAVGKIESWKLLQS